MYVCFQAVHCSLHGVTSVGSEWGHCVDKLLQEYIQLNIKYVSVCHAVDESNEGCVHLIDLVSEQGKSVAEALIASSLAQSANKPRLYIIFYFIYINI